MKYLKTYENFDFELAVGDYVLVNYDEDDMEQELKDYLKNNIAQVRYGNNLDDEWITVNYKDTPSDYLIKHYFTNRDNYEIKYNLYPRVINQYYIVAASKDKENLKQIVLNRKYNL